MLHMMIEGWLRSRRIMLSRSAMFHGALARCRFSSMTSMPNSSHASSSSGAGGLWAQRYELLPMACSRWIR
jgi:hypothetical protein